MPNSYSESLSLRCPSCQHDFAAEVWQIVDVVERRDLLKKIREAVIHTLTCPHCSFSVLTDAPLLVFRSTIEPHILFSPALFTTKKEDQQTAAQLISSLKDSFGPDWQEAWFGQRLTLIQRAMLPLFLSENLEAAWQELSADPQHYLQLLTEAWVESKDLMEQRKLLESTPALLSDDGETFLLELANQARATNIRQRIQLFDSRLQLFRACRQLGVEDAFSQAEAEERKKTQPFDELLASLAAAFSQVQSEPEGLPDVSDELLAILIELQGPDTLLEIPKRIQLYRKALNMLTRDENPLIWADLQLELANCLQQSQQGDRADNIEEAIAHYNFALEVDTRQESAKEWAAIQNNLADAYRNRIHGDQAENLEKAIQGFTNALEVYSRESFPDRWAATLNNLANTFVERIRGARADNMEKAITLYLDALEIRTLQDFPIQWANTQNNLAAAYRERIRGVRAANLEQTIQCFANSLKVFTREDFPEKWATTQNNLGISYGDRSHGGRADNLEQSILCFRNALEVSTDDSLPIDWAMIQHNLALAYLERINGDRAENLEQALQCCENALRVRTRTADPVKWAMTQNTLGNIYNVRIRGTQEENIEQAIQHFSNALEVRTLQTNPEAWASTKNDLAEAYRKRIRGSQIDNFNQAITHSLAALDVMQDPVQRRRTAEAAGRLAANVGNWHDAAKAFMIAIEADQELFEASSISADARQLLLINAQGLYGDAAYAHVQAGNLESAVAIIESGRARQMRETFEHTLREIEQLPELGFTGLYQTYKTALQQYQDLITEGAQIKPENHTPSWYKRMMNALTAYRQICLEIRQQVGTRHVEFQYFMLPLPIEEIQAQARLSPLVYIFASLYGGIALVVSADRLHSLSLEGLTLRETFDFVANWENPNTYLLAYLNRSENEQARIAWYLKLEETTEWVWQHAIQPVVGQLKEMDAAKAVLVPVGLLTLLPLHAAVSTDGQYASDTICFTYAPMANALRRIRPVAKRNLPNSILAVDNPNPVGSLNLPSSNAEVHAAMAWFDAQSICYFEGKEATRLHILNAMDDCAVLHFSTHGYVDFEKPLASGMLAADAESVTVEDFMNLNLDRARLAVLSACETSIAGDLVRLDEVISLPSGLIQAGVPAVIGTLWSVADISTAMLMVCFYELWKHQGIDASEALRRAQFWLRTSTVAELKDYFRKDLVEFNDQPAKLRFENAGVLFRKASLLGKEDDIPFWHPYFWAGFTYTGV